MSRHRRPSRSGSGGAQVYPFSLREAASCTSWYSCDMGKASGTKKIASPAGPMSICPRKACRRRGWPASCSREGGYVFDVAYTSVLKRAIRTLWTVLDELDSMWIPVHNSWRLNERHYGALQGLNKAEMAARYGDEQILIWRRSYDVRPPALTPDDDRWPGRDRRYRDLSPPSCRPPNASRIRSRAFCRIGPDDRAAHRAASA